MSHYAIVKRNVYIEQPNWSESKFVSNDRVIKYEKKGNSNPNIYKNLIYLDYKIKENLTFWEGEINQEILQKGEYLIIEDDCFEIERVEKSTDGSVVYYIQHYYEKSINYDYFLEEAEYKYRDYSNEKEIEKIDNELNNYTETLNKNTKLNKFEKLLKSLKIRK